jgi:hypothetical protein
VDAEKLVEVIHNIDLRLSAHTVLLTENSKDIVEIRDTLKAQNGRIGKDENELIEIKTNCIGIQREKLNHQKEIDKKTSRNRYIITTLIAVVAILSAVLIKTEKDTKVPIQLIYDKTDSTFVFPHLYIKRGNEAPFTEVHKLFVDIKKK